MTRALSTVCLVLGVGIAGASAQSSGGGLHETLASASPAMARCVERSRAAGEEPPRRLEVRASIAASGRVREARVTSASPPRLARCVEGVVEGLRFSRRGEATRVVFPVSLADR
ncbi:MAG TPA: hypothetical protein RMH99_21225 [Sandaracinaceae bacterium LLY-WYZ-13_1]|nr:hypothetical protein [Sandaracinaceae bacterium LLY-WYZ-13_1]